MVGNRGDNMRHMVMGTRGDMGARDQHVSSMGVVGHRGRVGHSLRVDGLIVVIGKVVEDIARIMGWRKTLGMWMSMKVVWHLWLVCCWHIIVWCRGNGYRSQSKD